jgi:hypothetical protein
VPSNYPGGLDSLPTNWVDYGNPGSQLVTAAFLNVLNDAVNRIEAELGVNPKGTYASVAARLAGAWAPDVVAAKPTGVAATDTTNLQAAIDATPAGGFCLIPGADDPTTPYLLSSPVTVTKHIRLEGRRMRETWQSATAGGALNTPTSPGVSGTILKQVTAATDVLQLSGSGISVALRNIGITFDSAIVDTNTGHGINAFPTQTYTSGHDSGLLGFQFDNVVVFGHDGNHYAFRFRNAMYGQVMHCRGYGGGGLLIDCDSFRGNFGNSVFEDVYMDVYNSGTADAYRLQSRTTKGSASGHLNLLNFHRPQANITGAAATAGTQNLWTSNGGASLPSAVLLIAPDLESTGANPVDFGGINSGTQIINGGLMNNLPAAGFDRVGAFSGYQAFTGAGSYTFKVPYGVTQIRVRAIGSGGGGGGGGSNAAAAANTGGGGGGAGVVTDAIVTVTPNASYTVTVGAAGTKGNGGAAGGNAGTAGGVGNQSSFGSLAKANGGGGGAAGPASATSSAAGGNYGRTGTVSTVGIPGTGGVSASPNGNSSFVLPPGVVGGAAGGASSTTLGGGGGAAATGSFPAFAAQGGGSQGTSATAAGVAGTTATTPGCGGGGGGGAPSGGAGGDGGVGCDGMVEVWW